MGCFLRVRELRGKRLRHLQAVTYAVGRMEDAVTFACLSVQRWFAVFVLRR